jgi:hypothetical protein
MEDEAYWLGDPITRSEKQHILNVLVQTYSQEGVVVDYLPSHMASTTVSALNNQLQLRQTANQKVLATLETHLSPVQKAQLQEILTQQTDHIRQAWEKRPVISPP